MTGLVGAFFKASIPYAGSERPVTFQIIDDRSGALRIETVPSDDPDVRRIRAWVSLSELAFLVQCDLVDLIGHITCTECGHPMELVDGEVQTVSEAKRGLPPTRARFLACTGCDNCREL